MKNAKIETLLKTPIKSLAWDDVKSLLAHEAKTASKSLAVLLSKMVLDTEDDKTELKNLVKAGAVSKQRASEIRRIVTILNAGNKVYLFSDKSKSFTLADIKTPNDLPQDRISMIGAINCKLYDNKGELKTPTEKSESDKTTQPENTEPVAEVEPEKPLSDQIIQAFNAMIEIEGDSIGHEVILELQNIMQARADIETEADAITAAA